MNNFVLMNLTTDKIDNFLETYNFAILIQEEIGRPQY